MDDDRDLDRLIRAAGDAFDPTPDLPERIGQRVRQRQARRRVAVSLGAVLLVAAIVGGGLALAAQDGPGDEVRTASDDPTTTWRPSPGTDSGPEARSGSTTTGPPPTTAADGRSGTIYALRGPPDPSDGPPNTLVEVDLATGEVLREVIPLHGMQQVESSGDEEWWVRRDAQSCGNFTWEEYHPAGAGGFPVPPAVDFAKSPDGAFVAMLQADPADCAAPYRLVVTDLSTSTEATLAIPNGSSQLEWRADSSGLAFATDGPDAVSPDIAILSVGVSHGTVAAGALASSPLVESDDLCSVNHPAFGPDGRLWYSKVCLGSVRIAATASGPVAPVDIEVSTTDQRRIQALVVNRRTGQVAFVANGNSAWVLDGEVPRQFLADSEQPIIRVFDLLWPVRP